MRRSICTIFKFSNPDETGSIFVKNLETTYKIIWLPRGAKPVRSVEDAEEQIEVN